MATIQRVCAASIALAATIALAGCRIDTHKNGTSDDVKIATPFGGMQVKTNEAVTLASVGLPAYPGAVPVKEDKDNSAADVNMSFGNFQLRVRALSFRTGDTPEQVEAFYRKGMKQYGDVILCRHNQPVGTPAVTSDGLSCESKNNNHVNGNGDTSAKMELKAGSTQHQHIVAIDPDGSGTKIGLVSLDLPGKLDSDDPAGDRD